jgi:pimeloyl-ACP methyl ester carboxylesterase
VLEAGPPKASEAVVFVHGSPGSAGDWRGLAVEVGAFARAVAPDLPGFGRADKPYDFDYSVPGYAAFLDAALDQLGVRRAHLVLHDFGGPIGLEWAAENAERFASVVLFDTGVLPGYRGHPLAWLWATPVVGELMQFASTPRAWRFVMARTNPKGLPEEFVEEMAGNYDWGTRYAVLKLYRSMLRPGHRPPGPHLLRPLDRPALVVWGAHDPFVSVDYAERQKEAFPRASVVVLEESGHWPFMDDPSGTSKAVIPFLRKQLR